jgi:hypothetical protein
LDIEPFGGLFGQYALEIRPSIGSSLEGDLLVGGGRLRACYKLQAAKIMTIATIHRKL